MQLPITFAVSSFLELTFSVKGEKVTPLQERKPFYLPERESAEGSSAGMTAP